MRPTNRKASASWLTLAVVTGLMCIGYVVPGLADDKSRLTEETQEATTALIRHDPSLKAEMDKAAGYVVFPGVGKGGIGVGAARGTGQVIVGGAPVARATMTQVSLGLQLGGQKYIELILLQDKVALERFLAGKFTMAAQVSAVAAASGAAANAKYADGVKVITMAIGGLMYEASVGGQKFGIERY